MAKTDDYLQGYEAGFAAGHAEGLIKGALARHHVPENFPGDNIPYVYALRRAVLDLEDENARLVATLRGYVLSGRAGGAVRLAHAGTASSRGASRFAFKPRHRHPFALDQSGAWKRAKGRLKVEDWATRLPPKVCAVCKQLFVSGRRDAKTCSPRCRTAFCRAKHGHQEIILA
jgi:hypothetical protein